MAKSKRTTLKSEKVIELKGATIHELERAYDKIHAWFFAYPTKEFSLNELSKNLEISKTAANVIVSQLEKESFLEKEILGKLWRIKANQYHPNFIKRKIPFNLQHVYKSGIIEWIKENIPNSKSIILFGSFRWGEDVKESEKESDLDIAVEVENNKPLQILQGVIKEFGYRKNVKVSIHIFSRNSIDLNLFSSIANGIVLDGFLEVRI